MAVRKRHVVHFRTGEALLALRLPHVDGRRFGVDVLGLKHLADAVDHKCDLLRGFDAHCTVLQRVIPFASDADQKIAGLREGEGESAGGIGLRFPGIYAHARAANRRFVFVDHPAVQSNVGVKRNDQTGGNRPPPKSR